MKIALIGSTSFAATQATPATGDVLEIKLDTTHVDIHPLSIEGVKRVVDDTIQKPKHNWANYKNEHFKGHKKPGTKWKKRKTKK